MLKVTRLAEGRHFATLTPTPTPKHSATPPGEVVRKPESQDVVTVGAWASVASHLLPLGLGFLI